jgi:hypothetical protein
MLLHPPFGFHDLDRVGGRRKNLRNQRVRIQGDRCDELIQLRGIEALPKPRLHDPRLLNGRLRNPGPQDHRRRRSGRLRRRGHDPRLRTRNRERTGEGHDQALPLPIHHRSVLLEPEYSEGLRERAYPCSS